LKIKNYESFFVFPRIKNVRALLLLWRCRSEQGARFQGNGVLRIRICLFIYLNRKNVGKRLIAVSGMFFQNSGAKFSVQIKIHGIIAKNYSKIIFKISNISFQFK
jgi:hypothetical protein